MKNPSRERIYEVPRVLAASSVRNLRIELMRLNSKSAVRQIFVTINTKPKQSIISTTYIHIFNNQWGWGGGGGAIRTDAIRNMPAPENQAALERFLGMTSYLNKFIKDYGEKTATLRELHHNDVVLFFDRNPSVSIRRDRI